MAWQTEMVTLLRVLVNDLGTSPTFADLRLQQTLLASGQLLLNEMRFNQNYVPDLTNLTFTPDPTDRAGGTRDDSYVNLVCLKAACLVERGQVRTASAQGILIRDGSSVIDLRQQFTNLVKLLARGACANYEDARIEYMSGQVRVAGAAVMTPCRIFAGFSDMGVYYPAEGRSPGYPFA